MNRTGFSTWKYDAALLFTVLVWGLNFPILKGALSAMPPHVINGFRFLVSALVLGSLFLLRSRGRPFEIVAHFRSHGSSIILLSLTGYLCYQLVFIIGIDRTTAGNAALIMASSPLWTAVFGRISKLEQLPRRSWTGLMITLLGTLVVVLGGAQAIDLSNDTFLGNMLMLTAAMLWGGYTAFSKPVLRHLPATTLIFYAVVLALPFLMGIGAIYLDEVDWARVTAGVWAAIIFSGGLSTGIVFVFWSVAIRHVGASQTAASGNLVPLIALATSYLILHEAVTWVQVGGGLMIIGGLLVMRRSRSPVRSH